MITISRAMARQFHAAARKCHSRRTRGQDREVVIRQVDGKLTFTAVFDEVVLQLAFPNPSANEAMIVAPLSLLHRLQEVKADPIELHCPSNLKGEARWLEQSTPHSFHVTFIQAGEQHERPLLPDKFSLMPEDFLKALHECSRSTADQDSRFAFSRVQVRGKAGQLIGTDARIALLYSGFKFPFDEDLLVPAIPLFGLPGLQSPEVRVGRTATHLVIATDRLTVLLTIADGKYPDVSNHIPGESPTQVRIEPLDASTLLAEMPGLAGADQEEQPVTLDLTDGIVVRGQSADTKTTQEIALQHSAVEGSLVRVAVDRRLLARAVSLGCRTLRIMPEKLMVAEGEGLTVLLAKMDADAVVPPKNNKRSPSPVHSSLPPPPVPERSTRVKPHEPNGRVPNGRPEAPPPAEDPLIVVEELRATLAEAAAKAAKLATLLRNGRREKKVLANVFAGLKQLNLE